MNKDNHIVFVDYIRVVACFLVMLVHACECFYGVGVSGEACSYSMLSNEANRFWVAFYDGGVGRVCVPLFMIVSAFLLAPLKPGLSMTAFYKKRLLRVLPPMLCFLLLYTFLPLLWGGISIEQALADFKLLPWNFPSGAGHLWFMYPLIGLYLFIPIISPWLQKASAKEERIFIALFVLSSFIPYIQKYLASEVWGQAFWNRFDALWYFSGFLGYLVLAHYIKTHLVWNKRKRLIIGSLALVSGAIFTFWSFWSIGVPGELIVTPTLEWGWGFCSPNLILSSFGAFILFSCIERPTAPRAVSELARLSFGMYLVHIFFLGQLSRIFIPSNPASPIIPVALAIPAMAILCYVFSFTATKLLSLLPFGKYIIGATRK